MRLFAAAAAVCLASFAGAVTLTWNPTNVTSAQYREVSASSDFAFAFTYASPNPISGNWHVLTSIGAYKDGAWVGAGSGTQHDLFRIQQAQEEVEKFWIGALRRAAVEGDIEYGSLMAGQSVGLVDKVIPIRELLDELLRDADRELVEIKRKLSC